MSEYIRYENRFLECGKCGKRLGVVTVTSIGTPHQMFGEPVCVDCIPGEIERMKEELASEDVSRDEKEEVEKVISETEKWLREGKE